MKNTFKQGFNIPDDLAGFAQETADQFKLDLVDVVLQKLKTGVIVQIFLSSKKRKISLDDCEKFSKQLDQRLFVEEVFNCFVRIEVASAGINREFKYLSEFNYFKGERIKIHLRDPVQYNYSFVGILDEVIDSETIVLDCTDEQNGTTNTNKKIKKEIKKKIKSEGKNNKNTSLKQEEDLKSNNSGDIGKIVMKFEIANIKKAFLFPELPI